MELADVSAHPAGDGRWTLVFTRDLSHPPEKVWDALTEPGRLKEWAPFEPSRDLGEPGEATLVMDGAGTDETVTKADRPHLLEYTWGGDLLRWELEPTETGTRLRLSHTMPGPEWAARNAAGWHVCLDTADLLLAGTPQGRVVGEDALKHDWQDLRDAYTAKLS
ncbi:SRPBCC family protein [Herbidospora cretacea]|uniref:SRPBCC family protein n=1 Tax=Herbidospora cretacea TaxID=28444 RepID=UPI000774CE26|nr:SRPBCC family protein [Herbidospora cretacea]